MADRLILIGVALIAIAGALWFISDAEQMAGLREELGLEAPLETDVERQEPAVMEAEIARLAALPVPGVEDEAPPPPEMGVLADATVSCVTGIGAMLREPKQKAQEAARRYLLVLGATAADPATPLLERRFVPLGELVAAGPPALRKLAEEGDIADDTRALLADFHTAYSNVEHPLYHGLQLYDQTFEALDFQALADAFAGRPLELFDCAAPSVLPAPPPEAPQATAG